MSQQVENIKPYSDRDGDKTSQVRDMFDTIAPAYDFMNRAMTLGIDRKWRRKAVDMVAASNPVSILDIACGTGDLTIALAKKIDGATVTGLDLSRNMLDIAAEKISNVGLEGRISLIEGDSLALPFADCSFDVVTVAYGVRNFSDISKGYREFYRVLKPGGLLCVIELTTPRGAITYPLYKLYTRHIIPLVGRGISKDKRAYRYLPESIEAVAQGNDMLEIVSDAGFGHTEWHKLTFGACAIYTAFKPK